MTFFIIAGIALLLTDVYVVKKLKRTINDLHNKLTSMNNRNDDTLKIIFDKRQEINKFIEELGDCEEARVLKEIVEEQDEKIKEVNQFYN